MAKPNKTKMKAAFKKAVAAAKGAGKQRGASAIAREIKMTRQAVGKWEICPAEYVPAVEKLSGISRYELRPDIFGAAP